MNPGDLYGRYQIIRRIGHGAMGEVYLALDGEVRNQVALKVVYHDADDNEILEAEQVGAELQRQLSGRDKRVVVVNRTGSINGDLFIEMEYIQGEDLSTMISRAAITPGQAAVYAMEICEMLENLHSFSTMIGEKQFTGIVHGDLKPKNIRINLRNEVKVLDFGIAKALSHTRKQTMNVFGSTAYCSPERIETGSMDLHSDLWSVGVLLYQMVSCRLPFEQATKESLERRIRSNEPPEPLAGLCPAPLRNVIFQMLARDPLKRYQTAVEAKEDLNRILRGESVAAVPFDSDATVRTEAPQSSEYTQRTAVPAASVVEVPSGTLWPGWRRAKFAMMAVVACLVIAWLVIQFTSLSDAGKLRADLDAERIANPDDAWQRFQKLNGRAVFSPLLWSARNATERKLVSAADHTILEYRNNDAPSVYETQWKQARAGLSRAMELDPRDNVIKGKLRLCEGHLARINATGRNRQKETAEAVARFQEAASLMKDSPDPYLGLARLYAYNLNDVEKAEQAVADAERRGFKRGKRETGQLADGYRLMGDRLWNESRPFSKMPAEEREYLQKARDNYQRSVDLYQQLGVFQNAARSRATALQNLQKVDQRMAQIQMAASAK